ncbi:hypothetical protein Hanom_Chr03g00179961 [Helianthus anomalus]
MGEDTLEFENAKKVFVEEREKFNAERKGLLWRVFDAKEKLAKEKQLNSNKQKEWETACDRTNRELQTQRDAIQERVASQKREEEYLQRIAKLDKFAEQNITESKASELLAEEVTANCKWLLAHAVPLISERFVKSHELANYVFELGQTTYNNGRKDGYSEGRVAAANNVKDYHFEMYKEDCGAVYAAKHRDYEFLEFGIVKAIDKLSRSTNAIEVLKKALGDSGTVGGAGASPSHQD